MSNSYVIQASPLSKLFMGSHQSKCAELPEHVFKSVPFVVRVPRSAGDIMMEHNKPVHKSKLLPVTPGRKRDEFSNGESETLFEWITGGPDGDKCEETDIYGIVQLAVDLDVGSAIVDVASLAQGGTEDSEKKAAKTYQDLQRELVKSTKAALIKARDLADWRVKRAVKITHENLMKQYETMRQDGKGVYSPSVAEAIGAYIIREEVEKNKGIGAELQAILEKTMKETPIIS